VFWALIGLSAVTTGTFVGFLIGFVALGGGFYLFVTILQPLGTEVGESAWRLLLNRSVARRHHAAIHASLREVFRPSGISQILRATGWNPLLARGLLVLLAAISPCSSFCPRSPSATEWSQDRDRLSARLGAYIPEGHGLADQQRARRMESHRYRRSSAQARTFLEARC
jgi:hypothetical protein